MNLLPSKIGKNDKFDRTARFTFPGSELESVKHINTLVQENLLKDSKNFKSSLLTKTHTIPFPSSSVRQKFSRLVQPGRQGSLLPPASSQKTICSGGTRHQHFVSCFQEPASERLDSRK